MTYIVKNGEGTLFKNQYKDADNKPDMTGKGKDLQGNDVELSIWFRVAKGGSKYMYVKQSEPYVKPDQKQEPDFDDEQSDPIPF